MTDFSLIIPTCGRPAELRKCLAAINECLASVHGLRVEVIASFDDDKSWLEAENPAPTNLRCVQGPSRGPAANRNMGASHAKGAWLIFLDDDCVPDPGFIRGYADYIQAHPSARALEGRTYPDRSAHSLTERGPFNEKGGCFYSCNMALRRDLFDELGGFDEDYVFSLEDMDLYTRLLKQKEPLAFVPAAAVMHPQKEAVGWKFFWSMHQGRLTYLAKHPDRALSYSCEKMWKIWLHGFFRQFLPEIVRYRGRGFGQRLAYEMLSLAEPLLLKLDARRYGHAPHANHSAVTS